MVSSSCSCHLLQSTGLMHLTEDPEVEQKLKEKILCTYSRGTVTFTYCNIPVISHI